MFDGVPQGWEEGRSSDADFFWPGKGLHLYAPLYGTQGIGQDEDVPPFPSDLSINTITAFEACTLENLKNSRESWAYDRWVDEWPGLTQ